MVKDLAYFLILGKPVVFYSGMITFIFLSAAVLIGFLNFKGIHMVSFKWHPRLSAITMALAVFHAIFGLAGYFNF